MYLLFIMSLYSLPEVCSDFLFLVVLLARRKKLYKHIHNLREIQAEKGSCSKTSFIRADLHGTTLSPSLRQAYDMNCFV